MATAVTYAWRTTNVTGVTQRRAIVIHRETAAANDTRGERAVVADDGLLIIHRGGDTPTVGVSVHGVECLA